MNSVKVTTKTITGILIIILTTIPVACDSGQGMMHGGSWSMNMGNWNWLQILISLGIGFLIGYLFARRRK